MEVSHPRKLKAMRDQENKFGKSDLNPSRKVFANTRGPVLGDLQINKDFQTKATIGKIATTTLDCEKKAVNKRSYKNIKSKIDTGLKKTVNVPSKDSSKELTRNHSKLSDSDIRSEKSVSVQEIKRLTIIEKEVPPIPPLPQGVVDIDEGEDQKLDLISNYSKDIYKYLKEVELLNKIRPNFLSAQEIVSPKMRATLVDWLVEVHIQFKLLLETFHLTVSIIDRYLQCVTGTQRNVLQLVGVTAMFIASKYEEIYPPSIEDFKHITDNAYTAHEIRCCERKILLKLNYSLGSALPISFLRRYMKAAKGASVMNHHLAKFFIDLCLVEYTTAHYLPSELAAAALCLSMFLLSSLGLVNCWTKDLEYYSEFNFDHIYPIMVKMAELVDQANKGSLQSVWKKYADRSLDRVSMLPQLKRIPLTSRIKASMEQ